MSPSSIKDNKIIIEMVPLRGSSEKIIDANETAILLAGLITHVQRSTKFNCSWSEENSIIKVHASEKGWPEIQPIGTRISAPARRLFR